MRYAYNEPRYNEKDERRLVRLEVDCRNAKAALSLKFGVMLTRIIHISAVIQVTRVFTHISNSETFLSFRKP